MTPLDAAQANHEVIRRLYEALGRGDGAAMGECYLPDATFRDPVFGRLDGAQTRMMWRMLTAGGSDLAVELVSSDADADAGRAHWRATYRFPATGRRVVNDIRARFRFADGRIAEHVDEFSFFAWSRQALGPPGLVIGWSPVGRWLVRRRVHAQLQRHAARTRDQPDAPPADGA